VPLSPQLDLKEVAAETPGLVGADLRNLVNEAALLAARKGRNDVGPDDFSEALEKIALGAERRLTLAPEERRRVAYHESGHALLGLLQPEGDPVRRVTVVPRGQALGVTLSTPETDRYSYGRSELLAKIKVALGGRSAERVVYGEITTGAESDIQHLTEIARGMVGRWGMSEAVGPLAVTDGRQDGLLLPGAAPASPAVQELVDSEVRRIVETAEQEVVELLQRERARLDALAHALLERETLDQQDAYRAAGAEPPAFDAEREAKATA